MLIAVHFPKAAGSSLGKSLEKIYGDSLLRDYLEDPAVPEWPRAIDPIGYLTKQVEVPHHVRCVFGHFHPNKYKNIKDAKRFVMLRHPVDTIISIYWYFRSVPIGGSLMRYAVENNLSVMDLANLPLLNRLMTWTYFDSVDMGSFDLIGRHEQRACSMKMLSDLVGVELDQTVYENRTPDYSARSEMEHDASLRKSLECILREDVKFYERHAFRDV